MTTLPEARMPFFDHLKELRKRIIISVISIGISFALTYSFAERIFAVLAEPFNEAYRQVYHEEPIMIVSNLMESFTIYLKVGMVSGVFLSIPVIISQIWLFVAPALRPQERKHAVPIILIATLLFVGGALFGYFGAFPIGFKYFLEITKGTFIKPMIRMQEYYELSTMMLLIFGCVFEAPLFVLFLVVIGLLQPMTLLKSWRVVIVGIAVAAAIFSPPDVGSMILVMVPMFVLYLVTIVFAFILGKRRANQDSLADTEV